MHTGETTVGMDVQCKKKYVFKLYFSAIEEEIIPYKIRALYIICSLED